MIKRVEDQGVTAKQFAEEIGVKPDRLLSQLKDAGIDIASIEDFISEEKKQKLLRYLQQHRHLQQVPVNAKQSMTPEKIVLRRAKTSEIKVGGAHGASKKTVSIQVRKKRTYVKRPVVDEEVKGTPEENAVTAPLDNGMVPADSLIQASSEISESPATDTVTAVAVEAAPLVTEHEMVEEVPPPVVEEKAEDKAKSGVKRKEKHRLDEAEEIEAEKHKKKKKMRDNSRGSEKNFEALLTRGADLSRVLSQQEEDDALDLALRKANKARGGIHGKVKVQAFTKPTARMIHEVEIPEMIHLGELAQKMSIKAAEVIKVMMKLGMMATINQPIDQDTCTLNGFTGFIKKRTDTAIFLTC